MPDVSRKLYSSDQNSGRDDPGVAIKFVVPTVANGKVYVGANRVVSVYGLLLSWQPAAVAPTFNPGSEFFTDSVSVSITSPAAGTSIYYTTDGSAPNLSSNLYTGPIAISSTTTLSAFATGGGYLPSATSSATFTQEARTPMPAFSTAAGTYNSAQQVAITDPVPGAVIHYTLDGSTPDGNSAVYQGLITIASGCVLSAVANVPGLANSGVAVARYSFTTTTLIFDLSNGFSTSTNCSTSNPQMIMNGSTRLDDTRLQLTDGNYYEAGTAYYSQPVDIRSFTTDFSFQISNAGADGFTFIIQASGPNAVGGVGGALGFGPDSGKSGIPNSVAIKFDVYNNQGEGGDSTGLFVNGALPLTPSVDLRSAGIDLRSGDTMQVHLAYEGAMLKMTITDGVTYINYSTSFAIDIPGTVGSPNAYVGFTGGTGGETASQKIMNWTFSGPASSTSATSNITSTGPQN